MRRVFFRVWLAVLSMSLVACSTVPEETEKARGVLAGVPLVLALSVIVVVAATGLIVAAVVLDRMVRTRKLLDREPEPEVVETEEEPADEVVGGITVGRAAVPRWLYGAYVLIPVFAFAYVFSNIAPEPAATEATPEPTPSGPCTECTIAAAQIAFDKDTLEVAAASEITVAFANDDSVIHDFTVWEGEEAGSGEQVATTGTIAGGAEGNAEFESPAAGETWSFNCTIHPGSMIGTLTSVEG